MTRKLRLASSFILGALISGCNQDRGVPTEPERPAFAIQDALHNQGNPRFYFLAPMVPASTYPGVFDGSQNPVVQVCEWTGAACAMPLIAEFTTRAPGDETSPDEDQGQRPEYIKVSQTRQWYRVRWHTDEYNLDPAKTYRIRVLVQGLELGFADIDVAANRRELRDVNRNEFIPLLEGKTLPIKFRIESGIFPLQLTKVSGDNQTALGGSSVANPLVVRLTDAGGHPAAGISVAFTPGPGNGTSAPAISSTDAQGFARAQWTLGPVVGSQSLLVAVAGAAGSPVSFSATSLSPHPAWCNSLLTFDGGLLPAPWTFSSSPANASLTGLLNDRLEAGSGQSGIVGAVGASPAGLTSLTVEYDASFGFGPEFNSQQHGIDIFTPNATFAAAGKMEDPCDPQSGAQSGQYQSCGLQGKVSSEQWTGGEYPAYSGSGFGFGVRYYSTIGGTHHVRISYGDGHSVTTVTRLSDNALVLDNYQVPIAGFLVGDVRGLNLHAFSGTWADNLRVSCQ